MHARVQILSLVGGAGMQDRAARGPSSRDGGDLLWML